MLRDGISGIDAVGGQTITGTDNTAVQSGVVDCRDAESVSFITTTGVLADPDATFAETMDESDASDMSGSNAVAAGDIVGTLALAGFTFAADNLTRKVGYRGTKRYVRLTITPTGNTGSAPVSVVAIVKRLTKPTANPTA